MPLQICLSSQSIGFPGEHVAVTGSQTSVPLQGFRSSQRGMPGRHPPVSGLQVSTPLQGSGSVQSSGVPATHPRVGSHVSVPLQGLPSSHSGGCAGQALARGGRAGLHAVAGVGVVAHHRRARGAEAAGTGLDAVAGIEVIALHIGRARDTADVDRIRLGLEAEAEDGVGDGREGTPGDVDVQERQRGDQLGAGQVRGTQPRAVDRAADVSVPSEAPVWIPFGSMIRPVAVSVVSRSRSSSGVRAAKYGSFGSSPVQ